MKMWYVHVDFGGRDKIVYKEIGKRLLEEWVDWINHGPNAEKSSFDGQGRSVWSFHYLQSDLKTCWQRGKCV